VPFAYAAGQILADAVTATKGFDHDKLASYIHGHKFSTVAGEIAYNRNGDWTEPRTVFTQFQNVTPNDMEQFSKTDHQVILWPDKYKTGKIIYPYVGAAKQ
jgi:branched-chain amino acid transport system substrate-binding protein